MGLLELDRLLLPKHGNALMLLPLLLSPGLDPGCWEAGCSPDRVLERGAVLGS